MSSQEGSSVNNGIPESLRSLSYVTIQDAAQGVVSMGKGVRLAKVDIRSAYRIVPVHPDNWQLMGMLWEQGLFIDTALPFRLRSAPKIFAAIADAAKWIVKQAGVEFLIHYLDDFLVIEAPGSSHHSPALQTLMTTFNSSGETGGPIYLFDFPRV